LETGWLIKGISCWLSNLCYAKGATVASNTTGSASAKTHNFQLAFPLAFAVVAAQLHDMASISFYMSDQSPLILIVPAELTTENDYIDNYIQMEMIMNFHRWKKCSLPWLEHCP
jgi:hypothetical protein